MLQGRSTLSCLCGRLPSSSVKVGHSRLRRPTRGTAHSLRENRLRSRVSNVAKRLVIYPCIIVSVVHRYDQSPLVCTDPFFHLIGVHSVDFTSCGRIECFPVVIGKEKSWTFDIGVPFLLGCGLTSGKCSAKRAECLLYTCSIRFPLPTAAVLVLGNVKSSFNAIRGIPRYDECVMRHTNLSCWRWM